MLRVIVGFLFVPALALAQIDPIYHDDLVEYMEDRVKDRGVETARTWPGTTYFFSASGDDARDCKARDQPCKSTARAVKVVTKPGDAGLFKRGDAWQDQLILEQSASGTEGAPIVWGNYGSGPRPKFIKSNGSGTNMRGRAHIRIDQLDFRKMQVLRLYDRTHHIEWTNNHIGEAGNACVNIAGSRDGSEAHNIIFRRNRIDRCGLKGNNGECVYGSESKPRLGKGGRDVLFEQNVLSRCGHEPFNVKSGTRRWTLDGNLVINYNPVPKGTKKDPGIFNYRLSNDPKAGHVIKNNVVAHNKGFGASSDAVFFLPNSGITAVNNLAFNNGMACLRGSGSPRFYLNTCYDNRRGFLNPEPLEGPKIDMGNVRCNIGASAGNNIDAESGLFVNAKAGDFRLAKSVKDCDLGGDMMDILGRERKGPWSYGAFQFTGDVPVEPPDPDPVIPDPVSIGWCECGCAEGEKGSLGDLHHVELCKGGCAVCEDDGHKIPLEKGQVIGPVFDEWH